VSTLVTKRIALLRAVNVAGQGKVKMAALKGALAEAGFSSVETLLASGNVVFDPRSGENSVEIETVLAAVFALKTDVLIRDWPEWSAAIAANPFVEAAAQRPNLLILFALTDTPDPALVAELDDANKGPERMVATGRHLLVDYANGVGTSKLDLSKIEKRLSTPEKTLRGTGRNWNTVLKLQAMMEA